MSEEYLFEEYHGLKVAWQPRLAGGGNAFGQDLVHLVRHLFPPVNRLLEFCAGPGFIGFSLLAHGHCNHLVLSDIRPAAIEAIRETIRLNGLEDKVSVYESDGLESIPKSERWDLVVASPPHYAEEIVGGPSLRQQDLGWRMHRDFYRQVGDFLAPGGSVLMLENSEGSTTEDFLPMIADGDLIHIRTMWYQLGPWPVIYYLWIKKALPGLVLDNGSAQATLPLRDPVDGPVEVPTGGPFSLRLVNETGRSVVVQLVDDAGRIMLWLPQDQMPAGTEVQLPLLNLEPGEYEVRDTAAQDVTLARLVIS